MPGEPTEGSMHSEDRPNVDESKYENMETAAAAGGAEAEARRQEMANWSERQGALAEQRARTQSAVESMALNNGRTAEELKQQVTDNAAKSAERGDYMGQASNYFGSVLRATESGIQETREHDGVSGEYRSPTHLRGEQKKSEPESPEGSQEA